MSSMTVTTTRVQTVQLRFDKRALDSSGFPEALLQDLKDRYYSVCRKLVRNRPWTGDENAKNQLHASLQFDKGNSLFK